MPNILPLMMSAAGAAGGASASQGTLWAWGQNEAGDLGLGTSVGPLNSTTQVGSQTNWQSVDLEDYGICKLGVGDATAIAIDGDGKLYTWGSGSSGRGGRGNTTSVCVPTQVGAEVDWATCSGGYEHWATTTGGEWWFIGGSNSSGGAGQGNTTSYSSPVQIGSETYWTKTFSVNSTGFAITNAGKLYAVGSDGYGLLGQGTSNVSVSSPVQVGSLTNWKQGSTSGTGSVCVLKTDGTIWAWGYNNKGQLGQGNTTSYCSPVQIGSATNWAYVTMGLQSTAWAINTLGELWGWGYNAYGEIGNGTASQQHTPVQVGSLTDWKLICGDSYTAAAVKTDGTLWTWGRQNQGNLGDGTSVDRSSPVQVGSATDWISVGFNGQGFHMHAIKTAAL